MNKKVLAIIDKHLGKASRKPKSQGKKTAGFKTPTNLEKYLGSSSMLHAINKGKLGVRRADGRCSECGASAFKYPSYSNNNERGYGCVACGAIKPEHVSPKLKQFIEVQDKYWNLPRSEMSRRHKAAKLQLRFLPYVTPEFPDPSGRVEVPLQTRAEAIKIFDMLSGRKLIEDATLHYADGHTETLL